MNGWITKQTQVQRRQRALILVRLCLMQNCVDDYVNEVRINNKLDFEFGVFSYFCFCFEFWIQIN